MSGSQEVPSPRAHLAATLRLVDAVAGPTGWATIPRGETARALLARPFDLPASTAPDHRGLKYDVCVTHGVRRSWGLTRNDRHEGPALWAVARQLAALWDFDLRPVELLRPLLRPNAGLTLGLGIDAPGVAPRLKLYLQENDWGAGVCATGDLRPALAAHGLSVEAWLDEAITVGVLGVTLTTEGPTFKLYVGGERARSVAAMIGARTAEGGIGAPAGPALDAAPGARAELMALATTLERAGSSGPSWHYATLRLGRETAPRVAMNRIYDVLRLGFGPPDALEQAWGEVDALFDSVGQPDGAEKLRALRASLPDLHLVPTATAIEDAGRSADVYVAAWPAAR